VLLEAFVNRYRNPGVAPIHFATIVLPLTMILGALICFVGTPTVIIMAVCDIYPEVFSPKLSMVCALAGGGLFLAPLAIGAMHGQIREKKRGIVREGYGPKMMAYLFMLGIALPFPALYGAKFFYNYPFAHYPSYILEVKPSPELKAEIERFGLAEIKWHTPYDYSLDRQVIRYDFGEPVDGDWLGYHQKREMFEEVISQRNRRAADRIRTLDGAELVIGEINYPIAVQSGGNRFKCVLPISGEASASLDFDVNGNFGSLPVIERPDGVYLDVSSAFEDWKKNTSTGHQEERVCTVYDYNAEYYFIVYKLLLRAASQDVISYEKRYRTELSAGMSNFLLSVRSL